MNPQLRQDIANLMSCAGLPGICELAPLPGGANNRVFRVEHAEGTVLAKVYFHDPNDGRNRLRTEFEFSRFAWEHGLRCLPQPIASEPEAQLALYEFVSGHGLASGQVTSTHVESALTFFHQLNRLRELPEGRQLAEASEACFSIADHLRCVERRLHRLTVCPPAETGLAREFIHFVESDLLPVLNEVRNTAYQECEFHGINPYEPIAAEDRRLSPSDFGFHNAIVTSSGELRFVDFEYAGWDDPAKVVCDFLIQPRVPLPADCHRRFAEGIAQESRQPELQLRRIALLMPVLRLKWCCILLNHFLPPDSKRRQFAQGAVAEEQKAEQLDKARQMHESLFATALES
jgi:phosphotransferase family enzyme